MLARRSFNAPTTKTPTVYKIHRVILRLRAVMSGRRSPPSPCVIGPARSAEVGVWIHSNGPAMANAARCRQNRGRSGALTPFDSSPAV